MSNKEAEKAMRLAHTFISAFANIINRQQRDISDNKEVRAKCVKNGSFHFIPKQPMQVVETLLKLKNRIKSNYFYDLNFLDAGCGIGNILLLARAVGFHTATGLEFDLFTIEKANQFLNLTPKNEGGIKIEQADILTYKDYKKPDVVYFYRPFDDGLKQLKFEIRLAHHMKVGAYLMPIYNAYQEYRNDPRFKTVVRNPLPVYEKISNARDNEPLKYARRRLRNGLRDRRNKRNA